MPEVLAHQRVALSPSLPLLTSFPDWLVDAVALFPLPNSRTTAALPAAPPLLVPAPAAAPPAPLVLPVPALALAPPALAPLAPPALAPPVFCAPAVLAPDAPESSPAAASLGS